MDQYIVRYGLWFSAIQTLAVGVHFLGSSPFGGPLVDEPMRFLPEGVCINVAIIFGVTVGFAAISGFFARMPSLPRLPIWVRRCYFVAMPLYSAFNQFDLEVVRWLGQHVNASYLHNYFGLGDLDLLLRILRGDTLFTCLAGGWVAAAIAVALRGLHFAAEPVQQTSRRGLVVCLIATALATWLAHELRPSVKRWRRVAPGSVVLCQDLLDRLWRDARPHQSYRALQDLKSLVAHGQLATGLSPATRRPEHEDDRYPLMHAQAHGVSLRQFAQLPDGAHPNLVFIVFETLRGWKTGLSSTVDLGLTPQLDRLLREESAYFPWMHSNGFPSVEGCMTLHLGIWPDARRIIFSEFLHTKTRSWTEMLREAGYYTYAIQGADPSFDNCTPWIRRWYDASEYRPENHHDGPLVERFIEKHAELASEPGKPFALTLWTATTHPSYDVPADAGVEIAAGSEERYDQAIHYSQAQIVRLVEYLKARSDWDNTIVFIMGDHSQPTPYQRSSPNDVGALSPGHTWTNFAILGGWPKLPQPGARAELVSHVDIPSTILGLLNISTPNHFMGRDISKLKPLSLEYAMRSEGDEPRPVLSFGFGEVVWHTKYRRVSFSLMHNDVLSHKLDPSSRTGYGLLDESATQALISELPAEFDLERYRDVVRAYVELLEQDRIYRQASR